MYSRTARNLFIRFFLWWMFIVMVAGQVYPQSHGCWIDRLDDRIVTVNREPHIEITLVAMYGTYAIAPVDADFGPTTRHYWRKVFNARNKAEKICTNYARKYEARTYRKEGGDRNLAAQ